MKKSIFAAAGIAALAIGLAGCGGTTESEATSETTEDVTVQSSDTTATESAETTAESSENADTTTARTAPADFNGVEVSTDASNYYTVYVNKLKDGFAQSATPLYYTGEGSNYTYSVKDNVTSHSVEADLDSIAASLTDSDSGKVGNMLYAAGKNATGSYFTTVYYNIGESGDTASYAVIEYLSDKETTSADVAELLSSEYVTFAAK